MKHTFWIVLAATALGCDTTSSLSESPLAPPSGVWTLEAFELSGGRVIPVTDRGAYTLELVDDERLNVRADCNVCNGSYSLENGVLDVGLLACTLAACPPGSLDAGYLQALGSASRFELDGTKLRLVYDGGVLRFVRM